MRGWIAQGYGGRNRIFCASVPFPPVKMRGLAFTLYRSSLFANHTCCFDTEVLSYFLITFYYRKSVFSLRVFYFPAKPPVEVGFGEKEKSGGGIVATGYNHRFGGLFYGRCKARRQRF